VNGLSDGGTTIAAAEPRADAGSRISPGAAIEAPADEGVVTMLRVLFHLHLVEGAEQRFLDAYRAVRHRVAAVEGYVSDQVCQSADDPAQWLILSEWESPAHFQVWQESPEHRALAGPLVACTVARHSRRYLVRRATHASGGRADEREAVTWAATR
jgi:heme oxygenase (mycobilin-producing)